MTSVMVRRLTHDTVHFLALASAATMVLIA